MHLRGERTSRRWTPAGVPAPAGDPQRLPPRSAAAPAIGAHLAAAAVPINAPDRCPVGRAGADQHAQAAKCRGSCFAAATRQRCPRLGHGRARLALASGRRPSVTSAPRSRSMQLAAWPVPPHAWSCRRRASGAVVARHSVGTSCPRTWASWRGIGLAARPARGVAHARFDWPSRPRRRYQSEVRTV